LFRRIKENKKKKSGGGKKKAHMPQKNWRFGLVASGLVTRDMGCFALF
jgi:hypothetical protein